MLEECFRSTTTYRTQREEFFIQAFQTKFKGMTLKPKQKFIPPPFLKKKFFQAFCFFFWRLVARILLFNLYCFFCCFLLTKVLTWQWRCNPLIPWCEFFFLFFIYSIQLFLHWLFCYLQCFFKIWNILVCFVCFVCLFLICKFISNQNAMKCTILTTNKNFKKF